MQQMKRTIAIVCGGDSSEHDVSLRSAQGLYSFFDKERYNVYVVEMEGTDWQLSTMSISPFTVHRVRTASCRASWRSCTSPIAPVACWLRL